MMQRPANLSNAPTAPPPIDTDTQHLDMQSGPADPSGLPPAATTLDNQDSSIISPVAASTRSQPGVLPWNMSTSTFGRSYRDTGPTQRPPLGPRGGSGQLPPSNTGLALTDATDGTLGQQRINQAAAPKAKVGWSQSDGKCAVRADFSRFHCSKFNMTTDTMIPTT